MTDWKETLFVWKGILTINNDNIKWKGSWVSTNDAINNFPTDNDFVSSDNSFILYSNTIAKHNDDCLDIKFDNQGYYLLDNGNGLEKFSDIKHNLYCIKDNDDRWYCYAKGDTEFGPFISKGIMTVISNNDGDCDDNDINISSRSSSNSSSSISSSRYSLTLARRYVYSKKDSRLNLPIETSTRQMIELLSSSSSTSITSTNNEPKPWVDLPMKDKKKQSKKRDRDH